MRTGALPQGLLALYSGLSAFSAGKYETAVAHLKEAVQQARVDKIHVEGVRGKTAGKGSGFRAAPLTDALFAILDRARHEMLDFIAGINDEGLRRNYLNKVPHNHDITLEWTRQAAARGQSAAPFTERETRSESFAEHFRRLVEIGNNLTAERDPQALPDTTIGFTRIVKRKARGNLPQKQIENLSKVHASAEHLLGLINSVLDLAKIEVGRMDVLPGEYEVEALVEMCLATAQPLARPSLQMGASVPPDLPTAYSNQDKIRQILLNTLSNAAKFTHEGSITLRVAQQDGCLVYDVIDTGIGMKERARVFEEFQQAESTTSRDDGGTGLGLPISKQLAQLPGGDLLAASVEGEGSTFTLRIPTRLD